MGFFYSVAEGPAVSSGEFLVTAFGVEWNDEVEPRPCSWEDETRADHVEDS